MQAQPNLVTLRDRGDAKAVIAPELGAWLLRYIRHVPGHGYVDVLHFSQEVVDRYPNQMYAGNPLLFPLVSFNHAGAREHFYEWKGESFAMPQHGFARRSNWKIKQADECGLTMELRDSAETLRDYPFQFRHEVTYELQDGRLHFRQQVENTSQKVMPFSTGIHPYFKVPVFPGGDRNACYLELPDARIVTQHKQWQSWTAEPFAGRRLPVKEDVSGTLFLTDLAQREIGLVDPAARLRVTLNFEEAAQHRFVALWAKSPNEPHYCIEPWTALPNSFARKETELILLDPGQKFAAAMWMDLAPI